MLEIEIEITSHAKYPVPNVVTVTQRLAIEILYCFPGDL